MFSVAGCPPLPHLFIQGLLPRRGHLRGWRALAGAPLQQVNPRGARALLVLKVEQHILVKREKLVVPAAVLRGLLAQVAALGSLLARQQRQKQRVSFVVPDTFLHFLFVPSFLPGGFTQKKHGAGSLYAKLMFAPSRVNFPLRFSSRGQRKSWSACGRASAGKLILTGSACESDASRCPCYRAERLEMQTKATGISN